MTNKNRKDKNLLKKYQRKYFKNKGKAYKKYCKHKRYKRKKEKRR
jgi:hypothetical protein